MTEQTIFYHNHPVGRHDVICGKKCEKHPGNTAFRKIVFEFHQQYQTTSTREMKKQIIEQVIERVTQLGGRFIKDDGKTMIDVTPQYAYEKVSHALRSARPTNAAKAVQESSQERKNDFDDLLSMQQRLFYSYLMASNNDDDGDSATSSTSEDTQPRASSKCDAEKRPSLCSVMDQATLTVLLGLHQQQPV